MIARTSHLAVLLGVLSCTGCASTMTIPWMKQTPHASAKNPVVQVVCMWEPSEGHDPQGAPCRGFAGQILFLGNKGGTPVAVDGDVVVSVFDDLGSTPEQKATPIHQFRFDAKAWNQHLHVGTLGPTYHCFIPYTRKGGREATCELRLQLDQKDAKPIMSPAAEVALRGKKRDDVQLASQASDGSAERLHRTTTIPLNKDQRHVDDPEFQNERVQQLMQDYLKENPHAKPAEPRMPQTSQRIRFDGRRTEVVSGNSPTQNDNLQTAAARSTPARRHVLSSHPLNEAVPQTDDAQPVERVARRPHPFDDDVYEDRAPQFASPETPAHRPAWETTAVKGDSLDGDWTSTDPLNGQTSSLDR